MNHLDEQYSIRLARKEEIEEVMEFVKVNWKSGHIMGIDREYFEYEFLEGDRLNVLIAKDRISGKIDGFLGVLKSSNNPNKTDIWSSIWKVMNIHEKNKLLGVELKKRAERIFNCRYNIGIGLNAKTAVPLMRLFFNRTVRKMRQFYLLNLDIEEYNIAKIVERPKRSKLSQEKRLFRIDTFENLQRRFDINDNDKIPYKDEWYVNKKFFCNPRRKYIVYGIGEEKSEQLEAFFIARESVLDIGKVLRVVDYYGEQSVFADVGGYLEELLIKNRYEYMDFYHWGFDEEVLRRAGFVERRDKDQNIIPNYFEPFERKNVDIWIQYEKEGTLFFKADGDQDRANEIVEEL